MGTPRNMRLQGNPFAGHRGSTATQNGSAATQDDGSPETHYRGTEFTKQRWDCTPNLVLAWVRALAVCIALVAIITTSLAQQIGNPATQFGVSIPRGIYAIRNARIVTVSGAEIESGTIVIRDGKIEAVGANVSVPPDAQTIEARGLWIYPGMMDAGTSMGLVEVGQGASGTVDTAEVGELNPNAKAIIAINPHSAHIAVTRVDGVTTVVSIPLGGLMSGQAAIINLVGTSPMEMAVTPYAALVINYPRTSSGGGVGFFSQTQQTNLSEALAAANRQVDQIRKLLRDAEATDAHRMPMQRTRRFHAPIKTLSSNQSFRMFAANVQ